MAKQNLMELFLLPPSKDWTQEEINYLIKVCINLSLALLRKRLDRETKLLALNSISLHDFAVDVTAPLFIKDKSGVLPIKKAALNWDRKLEDEPAIISFLMAILSKRIEQSTAKLLKETDPVFGKILRSFNHLVETGIICKGSWFGRIYLLPAGITEITGKPVDPDFLEKIPSGIFQGPSRNIIDNLFKLIQEEHYFTAIPLNALVLKVKKVNASFLESYYPESGENYLGESLDIRRIIDESVNTVENRISRFYLAHGKLSVEEGEIFRKIIRQFASELVDGGISRGLYEYISPHMEGLTKEEYYKKYHEPIDYLLRLLKKEISGRLAKLND